MTHDTMIRLAELELKRIERLRSEIDQTIEERAKVTERRMVTDANGEVLEQVLENGVIVSSMPVTEAAELAERDSIWFAAFALTASGPEEIGRYTSVREAVTDLLNRWPKDTEKDVAILGNEGTVVHLWRGLDDPAYCDVVYPDRREGYRCLPVTGEDGRVQTRVTRLE